MQKTDPINHFIQQISQILPASLRTELEHNLKQGLQHLLQELSLVSADEFNIQNQVLQKTQEKLHQLEARIAELERCTDKS